MYFISALVALFSVFALAQAAAVPEAQASKKCYTTHTGVFRLGGDPAGLNSNHQVVFPAKYGKTFKVAFQRCPGLTRYGAAHSFSYWGRIVAIESKSIKANQCLASIPLSTSPNVFYPKFVTCGSDTNPAPSQTWNYIDDDIGKMIWLTGQCGGEAMAGGYLTKPGDYTKPLTTKDTHLVEMGCGNVPGGSVSSFTLSG